MELHHTVPDPHPAKTKPEQCIHCGKEVRCTESVIPALKWRHVDGFFNCDGYRGHSETYAEPRKP